MRFRSTQSRWPLTPNRERVVRYPAPSTRNSASERSCFSVSPCRNVAYVKDYCRTPTRLVTVNPVSDFINRDLRRRAVRRTRCVLLSRRIEDSPTSGALCAPSGRTRALLSWASAGLTRCQQADILSARVLDESVRRRVSEESLVSLGANN